MKITYDAFLHGWLSLMSMTDHHVFRFPNVAKEMEAFKRATTAHKEQGGKVEDMDFNQWGNQLDAACVRDRLPEIFNSTARRKENG